MGLRLNFSICSNCKKFEFNETTGIYDAITNTYGWGAPNPIVGDAETAILEVFKPNNTTSTADLTIDLFAESPAWPTTDETQTYEITNTDLGLTGKLTDGMWKFVYSVTIGETTYQQTITIFTLCNIKCCVDGLFAAIEDFECDCMQAQIDKALTAQALLKSLESAGKCGNLTRFTKLQSMLERMCNNVNCCS